MEKIELVVRAKKRANLVISIYTLYFTLSLPSIRALSIINVVVMKGLAEETVGLRVHRNFHEDKIQIAGNAVCTVE